MRFTSATHLHVALHNPGQVRSKWSGEKVKMKECSNDNYACFCIVASLEKPTKECSNDHYVSVLLHPLKSQE